MCLEPHSRRRRGGLICKDRSRLAVRHTGHPDADSRPSILVLVCGHTCYVLAMLVVLALQAEVTLLGSIPRLTHWLSRNVFLYLD